MSSRHTLVPAHFASRAALIVGALGMAATALLTTGCESEESRNARLTRDMEAPAPAEPGAGDVSPENVEAWLGSYVRERSDEASPPVLTTTVAEKQWRLTFPGRLIEGAPMQVEIALHPAMTVLMAPLLPLPASTSRDLLASLMVQNYELYQSKLSISPEGQLFASYEVPNRLLDRRELLENVEDLTVLGRNIASAVSARLGEEAARTQPPTMPHPTMPPPSAPSMPHAGVPVD